MAADEKNVLKVIVDDLLERNVHPDRRAVLEEWREENTSEEEKEAALSDEERAQKEQDAGTSEQEDSPATATSASDGRKGRK